MVVEVTQTIRYRVIKVSLLFRHLLYRCSIKSFRMRFSNRVMQTRGEVIYYTYHVQLVHSSIAPNSATG